MRYIAPTLWDLLAPLRPKPKPTAPAVAPPRQRARGRTARGMQQRYDELVREMKARYGLRVRKWRSSTTGCAWELRDRAGNVTRMIESPYPRGPMSCAIFLHEVGHHAIGFGTYRPRCLEEYHAWRWALEQMEAAGLNVTDAVRRRMAESLHYAVDKARRRGLKNVPAELAAFEKGRALNP